MNPPTRTQMMLAPSREVFENSKWQSDPAVNMAKGACLGFSARILSNLLRNKAILWRPGYHMLWSVAGAGFGFAIVQFKRSQMEEVEKLRDKLTMRRMMRQKQQEEEEH